MDFKKKLEELIVTVIREGGSDLHLGVGSVPAIRVSGELVFLVKQPESTKEDLMVEIADVKQMLLAIQYLFGIKDDELEAIEDRQWDKLKTQRDEIVDPYTGRIEQRNGAPCNSQC